MDRGKMIALIAAIVVIIAAIVAVYALTSGQDNKDSTVKVTGVTLYPSETSLQVGSTSTLTAKVAPANASNKIVTWSSDAPSVATVINGQVTAVSVGTATITATTADGGFKAYCKVTVTTDKIAVTGITLDKETLKLRTSGTGTLAATVMPQGATDKTVSWSTSDASVVAVSNGVLTAISPGTATITATTADGGFKASCVVTVIDSAAVSSVDDAVLKVYGNVNGDKTIDSNDLSLLQSLVDLGTNVTDSNVMADANNDGKIDVKDIAVVQKIIARQPTEIWHVNYHDQDGDGTMDVVITETLFPISSIIMTGSSNSFMLMWMLGITEEIKGASYSSTSIDKYFQYYLDTSKVERLGTSSMDIPFENGKIGSSNVIAEKGVTALISDWNRSYIKNWQDYESSGIDVVRVAAASVEMDTFSHSALLLGLLMNRVDRSIELVEFYENAYDQINEKLAGTTSAPKFMTSSGNGYVSVGNSDYNKVGTLAGGEYALSGLDTSGSSSIKIAEYPQIFNTQLYNFDYILHLRTGHYYANDVDTVKLWDDYTAHFTDWEKGTEGQYIICGGMPVPMRVAYAASVLHPEAVTKDFANGLHQQLVDKFFNGDKLDISSMSFIIHNYVSTSDEASLKVYGNADGDYKIDSADIAVINYLIDKGVSVTDATRMADANNDGKIDAEDVAVVQKIIAREPTPIWHVNYHDQDENGTMDIVIAQTQFPVDSIIMTGSSNAFMLMWMLGITEEIKGASYSATSVDKYFKYYLDTTKVEKVGTSSTTIPFENGAVGSSNIIAEKGVTTLISDWNRTYITNWQDYENAGIDVVRISAAAVEMDVFTHSALLVGLLMDRVDRSIELVKFYENAYDQISAKLAGLSEADKVPFIASSMTGYISVGDSDYNNVGRLAGGVYALESM
ncbi:MAG: Ig-like domain-containing protein, partial [Candidatus Methanomethylophilaceae archaeon]|nr:Ig-like domain-containing protein [Candidatus Methanomethylophilaceae archaeon]